VGSLLGWQFTIAQTGKSAADEEMFPAFFSKVNRLGSPITGMIVLGIVQSLLALSTISPTLSKQFTALGILRSSQTSNPTLSRSPP
jgi:putrescine:ornithine antiporter